MLPIPNDFARAMAEVYGDEGVEWLKRLPALVREFERRWSVCAGPPFPNLTYNYVLPARRADGTEAVLKLGVPNPELLTEFEALRLFDGRGIARLLEADAERGVLLVERLVPGMPLSILEDDDRATLIAAQVMRDLWRPLPADHTFPSTRRWAKGLGRLRVQFGGGTGPLPARLVEQAERLFSELHASAREPVLLHGDLHHDNILAAQRSPWLALDPKGLAGEPEYETGALLRNPVTRLPQVPDLDRVLARRIALLSEALGFDRARLRDWALAQAVLSAWWSIEDHAHGWEPAIRVAESLSELRGG